VPPAVGDYDTLVAKSTTGSYANYNLLVDNGHVNAGSSGWMIAYNGDGTGTCGVANAESSQPTVAVWTHIAAVYDSAAMTLALYVDGTLAMTSDEPACAPAHTGSGGDLTIGTEYSGAITKFDGSIDDVRVYNRALSAAEILSVMAGN
jgi:Concanavalin A-like lectin/glucanases superfamily